MPNKNEAPKPRREDLHSSLALLMRHEPTWTGATRVRGEATMLNLMRQIDEIDGKVRR